MTVFELISKLSQTMEKKSFRPWNSQSPLFIFFLFFTIAMVLIFHLPVSNAAEVSIAWDASDGASGYYVYCGTNSGDYEDKIDVANNLNLTVTNLSVNQVYHFAVTAYNGNGESDFSTEISHLATPNTSENLNLENFVIESYGINQDQNPVDTIEDDGATLRIRGNGWKKINFPYTLTPNTFIEFDFKSSAEGEIHGIGFDNDNDVNNPIRTFQLYGTQTWGIPVFNDYQNSAPNWKHYRIPVGQFYTGEMRYLTFSNDHDGAPQDAESFFSNIRVYEGPAALNFSDFVIESYGTNQDQNPADTIEDDDATLHIRGNGWKKIYFPYTLTPNTFIEFDFKSSAEGEIHGIGFDNDNDVNNPIRTFRLYGTQTWGIPVFNDYQNSAPNWKHYRIPVGQFYTGEMRYLTFSNDHDGTPQDAESFFSYIRVYEGPAALNFSDFVIESYGTNQDQNPVDTIEDDDATLHIRGNGWKKIYFPYTLTPNTVIEFNFKSSAEGEIHGIGFDNDNDVNNSIRTFQLYGTQTWSIPDFNDYQNSAPNWKHYRIPVGQFYTGEMRYLTFSNDHDDAPQNAESFFSNLRIYD